MEPTNIDHSWLNRAQKNLIHFGLIVLIAVMLWHEGGGASDWSFVALAITCEVI